MGRHACPTSDFNRVLKSQKKKKGVAVLAGRFGRRVVGVASASASTGGGRLASGRDAALGIRLRSGEGER